MNLLNSQRDMFHTRIIQLEGNGKSSALELLIKEYEVSVVEDSSHQSLVTSINGIKNIDPNFWRYAIAGAKVPLSASEIIPEPGEKVLWWFGDNSEPPALVNK